MLYYIEVYIKLYVLLLKSKCHSAVQRDVSTGIRSAITALGCGEGLLVITWDLRLVSEKSLTMLVVQFLKKDKLLLSGNFCSTSKLKSFPHLWLSSKYLSLSPGSIYQYRRKNQPVRTCSDIPVWFVQGCWACYKDLQITLKTSHMITALKALEINFLNKVLTIIDWVLHE